MPLLFPLRVEYILKPHIPLPRGSRPQSITNDRLINWRPGTLYLTGPAGTHHPHPPRSLLSTVLGRAAGDGRWAWEGGGRWAWEGGGLGG